MASRGGRAPGHIGRGSAGRLALPLLCALGCGNDAEPNPWFGTQDCLVGIPAEDTSVIAQTPPVSIPLTQTRFYQTGTGFYLQDFTVGPIAGFFCESVPFQVVIRYGTGDEVVLGAGGEGAGGGISTVSPSNNAARPPLARPVVMEPFECRATDGRSYILSGKGAADLQSMFIDMTFSAWLPDDGQATLLCTTRYQQVSAVPDAGVAAPPPELEMQAPPEEQGDGAAPVEESLPPEGGNAPGETPPDPGAAAAPT